MDSEVRKDLIGILKQVSAILDKPLPDTKALMEISNHTVHDASIYQDSYSISVGILVYSLSKAIGRLGYSLPLKSIRNYIAKSISCLESSENVECHDHIKAIMEVISKSDEKYGDYVQEIIRQASIRKGSNIYRHGISASKTASLLGISLWEFYDYLSATNIFDQDSDISSVRQRLKYTRSLFNEESYN
ncbi:hypothetical protein J4401_03615 [Candidatus Woesearchaeota archaeon]|nr:hypothetical protein [Candidatus Woesearchaeota archaeon]